MRIVWLNTALDNLMQIRNFISETDPGNAVVVLERIFASVESLRQFRELGRAGRHIDTRELVVPRTPYLVAYRIQGDAIEILRVLHGAQRWPEM